eukprot:TRINITY_DN12565_c0_g2_i4.p1 TRINITY_DN12565_c0_g2~~TRINITY_DN12565_c0_g2_i4.p1  ORF type:complete len:120 (-),score=22.73 TRINITY_DN12565_c0_g2_i4:72-401(-)
MGVHRDLFIGRIRFFVKCSLWYQDRDVELRLCFLDPFGVLSNDDDFVVKICRLYEPVHSRWCEVSQIRNRFYLCPSFSHGDYNEWVAIDEWRKPFSYVRMFEENDLYVD